MLKRIDKYITPVEDEEEVESQAEEINGEIEESEIEEMPLLNNKRGREEEEEEM